MRKGAHLTLSYPLGTDWLLGKTCRLPTGSGTWLVLGQEFSRTMSTLGGWSHFKSWVRSVLLHPGKHPRQYWLERSQHELSVLHRGQESITLLPSTDLSRAGGIFIPQQSSFTVTYPQCTVASRDSHCVPVRCEEMGSSETGSFHFDKENTLNNQYLSPSGCHSDFSHSSVAVCPEKCCRWLLTDVYDSDRWEASSLFW